MHGFIGEERNLAIETRGLSKHYGSRNRAVDALDLNIRRGEIYGFLGPNGAGKTTTLRMLLGLIAPTSGSASVVGEEPGSAEGLSRVGALIEYPAFYPYLSGRDNLRGMARLSGAANPKKRAAEALERVGLATRAKDKFKNYSLGMKQRLGVAATLLKDPELLILDEPTNGLDPQGMTEMRELIRSLGREGKTVLLSSHLMGEIEQVCDRVGIVNKGRIVMEGLLDHLRGKKRILLHAEPLDQAEMVARMIKGIEGVDTSNGMMWLDADPRRASEITFKMMSAGINVNEMRQEQRSLEDVFLQLTGGRGE